MQITTGPTRRLLAAVALAWALACRSLLAQDAALVLSTSVGYNTQRASLKLTPEQASEAERLGREASRASAAGRFGEALNDMAQGVAIMRGVAWTPEVEFASALRGKLDHAMVAPGPITVTLAPLYPTDRAAAAKLRAELVLTMRDKEPVTLAPAAPVDPSRPFAQKVTVPASVEGNALIEVHLTTSEAATPVLSVFTKALPIHVESLAADEQRLKATLAKIGKTASPALPSAEYTLRLYDLADRGEANPRAYNFKTEFANAQAVADAILAGKDPFAAKAGDFHKAYRSAVDQTLQPYRVFIPAAYDRGKATPLVVALHGMGGDENTMFDSYGRELTKDAGKAGFLVVAPKGRDPASMYRGSAEKDVLDVIAEVERDYNVDRSRVYLMGHSMGAYGTWSIAIARPEMFAALGPISGGGDTSAVAKIKDIPQYVTHGDNDMTVNVSMSRAMVEAGKKVGAPITYVEVPGGSHVGVAQPAMAPMMEFFAKQARKSADK